MFGLKRSWIAPWGALTLFLLAGARCDGLDTQSVNEATTKCVTNQAQIAVFDGFSQILCGCAESNGTNTQFINPPSTMTCTFPKGTTVFIQYRGAHQRHQIVSTGTPTFPSSSIYNPEEKASTGTFAFLISDAGNYSFQDSYNTAIRGTFVAQ